MNPAARIALALASGHRVRLYRRLYVKWLYPRVETLDFIKTTADNLTRAYGPPHVGSATHLYLRDGVSRGGLGSLLP